MIDPALWERLHAEARARAEGREPAHDFSHVERVVHHARILARAEKVDEDACALAALLHELFTYPKGHPDSSKAGDVCAEHAQALLEREGAPAPLRDSVCAAIRDHAFSKGVVPEARVAQILQDADRLDAIGAVGLARMWATTADMKRPFYSPRDPFCEAREPDDKAWGLDHVFKKLLRIPERLHTKTAKELAVRRLELMALYLAELKAEIPT